MESVARGPTSSPWQDTAFCCTLARTAGMLEDKLLFQYCFCVPTAMLRWYQHPCWQHLCLAKPSPLPDVSFRLSAWFLLNLKETLFSHISVSTAFLAPSVLRHRGMDFALETWQPKSGLFPISLLHLRSKSISFEITGSIQPSFLAFTSCRCFEILTSVNWEKTNKQKAKQTLQVQVLRWPVPRGKRLWKLAYQTRFQTITWIKTDPIYFTCLLKATFPVKRK